ncbi:hypothetical protein Scep_005592 [Stephania cephalantha]|uniref:BTB/POZ domain-containing protein n=1 Tax=Stephania cephalantha TaxID=152367 RepID=A0AAP0KW15_9MAGN
MTTSASQSPETQMDDDRNSRSTPQPQQTHRIKLNVGGELFETTAATLLSAGPDSLLAALASSVDLDRPIFIDRDPEIFSVLLSLLRTNRLPSSAIRFSKQELAEESLYYGLESRLRSAASPPPLSGIDASLVDTIRPAADAFPSAFSAGAADGSLWIAHGGQISAYDWNLTHLATVRTHLDEITAVRRVWPDVAAVGSQSAAGLHFYDLSGGRHVGSAHWTDSTDPRIYKTKVFAVADSPGSVFASFDSNHRENCIIQVDKSTLQITAELGRQSGNSAKAVVAGKLKYLPESGAVFGSAVSFGAFGYAGYMRIWDPRRGGKVVWETNEPGSGRSSSRFGDSFADVDVDVEEGLMFKVGSKTGDVAMADLRNLGEDPWVYLEEKNHSLRNAGGGENSVMHCYGKQVFVGRERGLEVWSRVRNARDEDGNGGGDDERKGGGYRRNLVDRVEENGGEKGSIRSMEGGGERLFVSREGLDGIEVWESSTLAGAISVL